MLFVLPMRTAATSPLRDYLLDLVSALVPDTHDNYAATLLRCWDVTILRDWPLGPIPKCADFHVSAVRAHY
jgi:hypothetical protein